MKLLLFTSLFALAITAQAQKTIDVTENDMSALEFYKVAGGHPLLTAKFSRIVEGSPYYSTEWNKGFIILPSGRQFSNILVKLDILDNEVHYLDQQTGSEIIATTPIEKIIFIDTITKQLTTFANTRYIIGLNTIHDKWYQVLAEGGASLLKLLIKDVTELKTYGSATIEKSIATYSEYYVLYNNQLTRIKNAKDIADILPKKKEILTYISNKNLKGKSETDIVSVIDYFNSLK